MFNKVLEGTKCVSLARIPSHLLILVEIYVI